MAYYVDGSTQTIIAGLTKHPSAFPAVLSPTNQTTPPDDMPTKQLHLPTYDIPAITQTHSQPQPTMMDQNTSPSLLLRRSKHPPMMTRISLPECDMNMLDVEGPRSPPGTEAVLSPLPAANKLHAGHTPIFPRSLSPLRHTDNEHSGAATPDHESVLTGPLTLPAELGPGSDDRIELKVLDAELEKIAREQDVKGLGGHVELKSSPPSQSAENGGQPSRKGSNENRRRSSADEAMEVDGVILKKPRMNLGAPLGQVCE
ncbi:hypothetical protein BCR34DRAFT_593865 [Clohesyomyces aquaticus]|uniref:Uncharacterized protein n=1 Tax=Clohesyomyces aquaticus TaxID=1231657 RepID=A0A1Y1YES9_9PLEO|nr:hypothetical protein BCR34DRAFT_593865 [Clohesyomyces aquaticus]